MTRPNRSLVRLACTLPFVASLATACATKTQTGALAGAGGGALVGAGLGALLGGGKGAAIGAGIGAAAGAGTGAVIGHYMDKQEKALKEIKGAKVERQGDKLVVKFNAAILFDTGKSQLKAASQRDLAEFAKVLKEYKETDLIIEGHTDNQGTKDVNEKLSSARAHAVIAFLGGDDVARSRMTARGYADSQPVADNSTSEGRQQNRRVQVVIAANDKLKQQDAASGSKPVSTKK